MWTVSSPLNSFESRLAGNYFTPRMIVRFESSASSRQSLAFPKLETVMSSVGCIEPPEQDPERWDGLS